MRSISTAAALLGLFLLGAHAGAQDDAKKNDAKKATDPARPAQAAVKTDPAVQFQFGVNGLTTANVAQVKENLGALSSEAYVCESCKVERTSGGRCESCKEELKPVKKPVLQEVVPSVESQSIRIAVAPGRVLRYSDLEGALTRSSVQVDPEKFPITGRSMLVLRGALLEHASTIEKALLDAKLFEEVHAKYDPPTGEIHVTVRAGEKPPTKAKVTGVIESVGTKATLSDVVWGPPAARS